MKESGFKVAWRPDQVEAKCGSHSLGVAGTAAAVPADRSAGRCLSGDDDPHLVPHTHRRRNPVLPERGPPLPEQLETLRLDLTHPPARPPTVVTHAHSRAHDAPFPPSFIVFARLQPNYQSCGRHQCDKVTVPRQSAALLYPPKRMLLIGCRREFFDQRELLFSQRCLDQRRGTRPRRSRQFHRGSSCRSRAPPTRSLRRNGCALGPPAVVRRPSTTKAGRARGPEALLEVTTDVWTSPSIPLRIPEQLQAALTHFEYKVSMFNGAVQKLAVAGRAQTPRRTMFPIVLDSRPNAGWRNIVS